MMKIQSWNAGPQYIDHILTVIRHRHNVRASEQNRPNYPRLGHYDTHLIDLLQDQAHFLYKRPLFEWWATDKFYKLPVVEETFGVIPIVPKEEYETITEEDLAGLTPSRKFIVQRMRTKVPHLQIMHKVEVQMYADSVYQYSNNKNVSNINFEMMLDV